MPYIIETTTPDPANAKDYGRIGDGTPSAPSLMGAVRACWPPKVTRIAVATLDEARSNAHATVHTVYRAAYPLKPRGLGGEHSDAQRAHRWHNVGVDKLPESGGAIGPLPDDTMIEVRRVGWPDLCAQVQSTIPDPNPAERDILNAFNAA
jgi:hypothetical protein